MPRTRRLTLAAMALLLVLVAAAILLEVGSLGLYALLHDRPMSRTDMLDAVQVVAGDETAPTAATREYPWWIGENILHPYLGFVRNPEVGTDVFNNVRVDASVNEYGFFGPTPFAPHAKDAVVVAITGGSVAAELYLYGRDVLRSALEQEPAFAGRPVELRSLAIGGMKQPQQLMALTYFLALGAHFDAIVNLDGFNEVVLSLIDNARLGVAVHYPRNWSVFASKGLDVENTLLLGNAVRSQARRVRWARCVAGTPLRYSAFVLFLWESADDALAQQIRTDQDVMRRNLEAGTREMTPQETGPRDLQRSEQDLRRLAVRLWSDASVQMARLSEANQIAYLHFLQPNQYYRDSKRPTDLEKRIAFGGPSSKYYRNATPGYPLLVEAGAGLARNGVDFVDLTLLFRDEQGTIYRDQCCHYNDRGYALVAREIAKALARRWPANAD